MNLAIIGDGILEWLTTSGLEILVALVVGAAIYYLVKPMLNWVSKHAVKNIRTKTPRSEMRKRQQTLAGLFTTIIRVFVVVVVIFTILSDLGMNLGPLLASAGIAGVALGFGTQSLVKDSIAGFFIIIENQYRIGDYIEVTGTGITEGSGTVEKISIRSTILRDRSGDVHFVSNGAVTQVINKTLGFSKIHFTFNVAEGTDIEQVAKIINAQGQEMAKTKTWSKKIIDPPLFNEVGSFSKDGVEITVSGMTTPSDQWKATSEFRRRLMAALDKESITIV
jgi:small conductance mechanosensitive channel